MITNYGLDVILLAAKVLQKEVSRHAAEMKKRNKNAMLPSLPLGKRSRRAQTLLGVLGGMIGPIAGLMTYSEGETLDAEIVELNQAQANLAHLVGKQIHIVRAQLEGIHDLSRSKKERLIRHEVQLSQNNLRLENLMRTVADLKCVEAVTRVLKAEDASLGDYIRTAHRILEIIHTSRQGKMHLSLLTTEQLEPVYRDIHGPRPLLMLL